MKIRSLEKSDEEDVVKLWRGCGLVMPWNDPYKDIARKLEVNPDLFLVGVVRGEIIASVMGGYEGHRGWINYLAVSSVYQRQGFGTLLMEAVEKKLRNLSCPKINIQVRSDNIKVISFYEALGYSVDKVTSLGKRLKEDTVGNA